MRPMLIRDAVRKWRKQCLLLATLFCLGAESVPEMVTIPRGTFTPLFGAENKNPRPQVVEPFFLDRYPVTVSEFQKFVTSHPEWQRSAAKPLFVDAGYLRSWKSDLEPSESHDRPITEVSWFAAKAYCQAHNKRLPSSTEWEYVALASESAADGQADDKYLARILAWYAQPSGAALVAVGQWKNFYGVYDIHGLVWEWVSDFNSVLVSGESRGDSGLERSLFCGAGAVGVSEKRRRDYAAFMRYAFRSSLNGRYTVGNLGFRCADSGEGESMQ